MNLCRLLFKWIKEFERGPHFHLLSHTLIPTLHLRYPPARTSELKAPPNWVGDDTVFLGSNMIHSDSDPD